MFTINTSYATAPEVELVINPDKVELQVNSDSVAVIADASGSNLKFEWTIVGVGRLDGSLSDPAVFYVPPQELDQESAQAIVSVKVTNDKGEETTKSKVFRIINIVTPQPTERPRPTPTVELGNEVDISKCSTIPKGSPFIEAYDGTYVKADGIVMELSVENRYSDWRTWEQNALGIKKAKESKSPEVLILQVQGAGYYDIYRFGVAQDAQLYWVYIPGQSTIDIGPCWKLIQELGRSTFITTDGKVGETKKQMIYILKK